jgi:hypothetical protein
MDTAVHISQNTIERYCVGRVPELELANIQQHLVCQHCTKRLEAVQRFVWLLTTGTIRDRVERENSSTAQGKI